MSILTGILVLVLILIFLLFIAVFLWAWDKWVEPYEDETKVEDAEE